MLNAKIPLEGMDSADYFKAKGMVIDDKTRSEWSKHLNVIKCNL